MVQIQFERYHEFLARLFASKEATFFRRYDNQLIKKTFRSHVVDRKMGIRAKNNDYYNSIHLTQRERITYIKEAPTGERNSNTYPTFIRLEAAFPVT